MLGAVCGDVLGSPWEFRPTKDYGFALYHESCRPTEDTLSTVAVASALLRDRPFSVELRAFHAHSSGHDFGPRFTEWASEPEGTLGRSAGNGACMRVSAIPALAKSLAEALDLAAASAKTSHHHPDSIRAAQATVAAGRLLLEGWDPARMGAAVMAAYGYDLATPLEAYRAAYAFEPLAEHTVYPSLRAVVEATSFEDGMRRAISMGGDADTMAAIAGGVLQFTHPVPDGMRRFVEERLPGVVREVLSAYERRAAATPVAPTPPDEVPATLRAGLARALAPEPAPPGWLARTAGRLRGYATSVRAAASS